MSARWKPARTPGGGVVPSGLDPHRRTTAKPLMPMYPGPRRAIVVNTYVSSDDDNRSRAAVECDVVLVRGNVPLQRVQVAQAGHGASYAHGLWVPQPSTRNISTGDAMSFRQDGAPASSYDDLDGDHVLVEFIDGEPEQPVITKALTHPRAQRIVTGAVDDANESIGWLEGEDRRAQPRRNELYFSHYGTEVRINAQGDLLIDATGAFSDPSTEDAEDEIGQIRFRVKDNRFFVVEIDGVNIFKVWKDGGQVKIDLGEDADQRVPLGDDLVDALKAFFDDTPNGFTAWIEILRLAVLTAGGTLDNSTMTAAITTLKQRLDAALSDVARVKSS